MKVEVEMKKEMGKGMEVGMEMRWEGNDERIGRTVCEVLLYLLHSSQDVG